MADILKELSATVSSYGEYTQSRLIRIAPSFRWLTVKRNLFNPRFAILVAVVSHLLLPWFRVTPLVQSKILVRLHIKFILFEPKKEVEL